MINMVHALGRVFRRHFKAPLPHCLQHRIQNLSETIGKVIWVQSPGRVEEFFRHAPPSENHFFSGSNWITAFPGGSEFTHGTETCLSSS